MDNIIVNIIEETEIIAVAISEVQETVMVAVTELEDSISILINEILGKDGKSAYEVAVSNGFTGTEIQWLNSIGSYELVTGELATGAIDNNNAIFSTAFNFRSGSLEVFNGPIRLNLNQDYQITSNHSISLFESPLSGENIFFNYQKL